MKNYLIYPVVLVLFSCNCISYHDNRDNCTQEDRYYRSIHKAHRRYFYKINVPNDSLNKLFVDSQLVRYREAGKLKSRNYFDCFANAKHVKIIEAYGIDTLHTVGCYKIDSLYFSFEYERNKKFEFKIRDEKIS